MQWVNLQKHLLAISSTTSSDNTKDLTSKLLHNMTHSKNPHKTIYLQQFNLEHPEGMQILLDKEKWSFQIRQLSYLDVGLAWKVWDSALLLSQWIFNYPYLFRYFFIVFSLFFGLLTGDSGKVILEVGSGCGPVGVVLASIPNVKSVTLSDRIESVL
jgi:Lysine methyltransferase